MISNNPFQSPTQPKPRRQLLALRHIVAGIILANLSSALAATDTWTGGATPSLNWSAPGNWLAGTAPQPADSLLFTNQMGAAQSPNNDFTAGTAFDGITFGASSAGSTFNLTGNSILLSGVTNGVLFGVTNTTALAETVNNNLTLDWGYYSFYSLATGSSLNFKGTLSANLGSIANFSSNNVKSTSFTLDGTKLIAGLGGAGTIGSGGGGGLGGFTGLATVTNGIVTNYTYAGTAIVTAAGAIGATTQANATNLELTATAAGNYTLNGGTGNTFINTALLTISTTTKTILVVGSADSGTLVMGTTNAGTGMYVGGFYVPGAQTVQELTVGGGTACSLTAGPMTGNPVPGEIVFAINGSNTSNEAENNAVIKDNASGGKVTLVKTGTGSMYFNGLPSTYTGGTYVNQGFVQMNGTNDLGFGPVYIAPNATVLLPNNTGTVSNSFFLSPGPGASYSTAPLVSRNSSLLAGTITLLGNPVSAIPGDRIGINGSDTLTIAGQITGSGTLDLRGGAANTTYVINNSTANPNNWTGGIIVDVGAAADSIDVQNRTPGTFTGNLSFVGSSGSGTITYDMWDQNESINALNSTGTGTINLQTGNGATLTMGNNNASGTYNGAIINQVSVLKTGSGTQTLGGANSYAGSTTVNGGKLITTTASSGNGTYTVTNGSTLDVQVAAPGGVLNVSSLTLGNNPSDSATLQVDTLATGDPSSAPINVNGPLVINGTVNIQLSGTELAIGSNFPLINYSGGETVTGTENLITPPGVAATLTDNGSGQITVTITAVDSSIEWLGTPGNNWDINDTNNTIWRGISSLNPAFYIESPYGNNAVTFDDNATGTTNVYLATTLSPAALTVTNDVLDYTFSGPGNISGTAGLTKSGSAALMLDNSGSNSFTGPVAINGGVLQVGNNDANGNLPGVITITNNGGLVFDRSDNALTVGGAITGTGGLTNNGTGTVTLAPTTSETYTGATVVNAGTLALNAPNGATSGISASSGITINNGATVQVDGDNSLAGNGPVVPVTINAGGTLTGLSTADGGSGTSAHIHGLLTLNGGTLTDGGTQNQATFGTWDLDGGLAVPGTNTTATIACLDVVPSEANGTTFAISAGTAPGGIDLNVSGTLINGSSEHDTGIIKTDSGKMVMAGRNSYTNFTEINGGVLTVNAPENPGTNGPLGEGGQISFGGGTLQYSVSNNFDYSSRFSTAGGQFYSIDTAGQNVTYATALTSGGASLTKIGNGSLTLSGANTYSGNTIVGGGELITTTESTGEGTYEVTNGATLDVQVLSSGAQLSMSDLTLGASGTDTATLQIDTQATGNPTQAPINVFGTLAVSGTINVQLSGTALSVGSSIPLISYSGESIGGTLNLITPPRITATLSDNNAGLISANITSAESSIEWLGGVAGNWDINDSANTIWQGIVSHNLDYYEQTIGGNDAVTFDDNATGTTAVNLTTTLSPAAITVNNSAKSYTFAGGGAIAGTGSLAKQGIGTLTIATTNSFSGGTTIGGGVVDVQASGALGAGGANVTGNGAALQVDGNGLSLGNALTLNGTGIAGGGALLNLANNNICTGAITLSGPAQINSTAGTLTLNSSMPITGGFGLTVAGNGNTAISSVIATGAGSLTMIGSGVLTNSATNTFTGGVNLNAGTLTVNATETAGTSGPLGKSGTISFNGGTLQYSSADTADYSPRISGAAGQQYNIDVPSGLTVTYASPLTSAGCTFVKSDAGTLTLSATNTFTGPITVTGGTFRANNSNSFNGQTITETVDGAEIYHAGTGTYTGNYNIIGFGGDEGDPANSHLGALRMATAGVNLTGTITVTGNAGITSRGSGTTGDTIAGQITGNYSLQFNRTTTSSSASTGTIILLNTGNNWTGDTTIADGTLKLGASGVIPNGPGFGNIVFTNAGVEFNPGIAPSEFDLGGFNQTINGLSNSPAVPGDDLVLLIITNSSATPATLTVGNNNVNGSFAGSITGGSALALAKIGAGTLVLAGTNTYTGNTTVSDGTLVVNGSLAATSVTVEPGATLAGSGSLGNNVAINSGGTLAPGSAGTIGTLTESGGIVSLAGTTLMKLNIAGGAATNDMLVGNSIIYGGTLTVTNIGPALAAGDTFQLFSTAFPSSAFTVTNLPALSAGLVWTNSAPGTLSVISVAAPISKLAITGFSLSGGTNLVINGTNLGVGTYYLLASTNVATPLSNWTAVATNSVSASGSFSLTNSVSPAAIKQQFYILSTTNN